MHYIPFHSDSTVQFCTTDLAVAVRSRFMRLAGAMFASGRGRQPPSDSTGSSVAFDSIASAGRSPRRIHRNGPISAGDGGSGSRSRSRGTCVSQQHSIRRTRNNSTELLERDSSFVPRDPSIVYCTPRKLFPTPSPSPNRYAGRATTPRVGPQLAMENERGSSVENQHMVQVQAQAESLSRFFRRFRP